MNGLLSPSPYSKDVDLQRPDPYSACMRDAHCNADGTMCYYKTDEPTSLNFVNNIQGPKPVHYYYKAEKPASKNHVFYSTNDPGNSLYLGDANPVPIAGMVQGNGNNNMMYHSGLLTTSVLCGGFFPSAQSKS